MTDGGHIDNVVAERALRILPPEEEAAVDGHAEICPPCRALLQEAQETANLLALAVLPARPPRHCKARLMDLVERDVFLEKRTPWSTRRIGSARWAIVAMLLLALVGWNIRLQREIAHERMIAEMVASDFRPSALKPQGATVDAAGRMFKGPNGTSAVLIVENLPPAPPGKIYQIWVADEQRQQPMETFQATHRLDEVVMHAAVPLTTFKWIMITLEDAGGSQVPSKTTVLLGDL